MRTISNFILFLVFVAVGLVLMAPDCDDDDDDNDNGGSSFCEQILSATEECDHWFDHYVNGEFVDYTWDEMMALCEGDWADYFQCSEANRQATDNCQDWYEQDLNECEDDQWDDGSMEDCKATVDKILFYCGDMITDADAFLIQVCEVYGDPECLEWCWENRTGCTDALNCYANDECFTDDDDDDNDDNGDDDNDDDVCDEEARDACYIESNEDFADCLAECDIDYPEVPATCERAACGNDCVAVSDWDKADCAVDNHCEEAGYHSIDYWNCHADCYDELAECQWDGPPCNDCENETGFGSCRMACDMIDQK